MLEDAGRSLSSAPFRLQTHDDYTPVRQALEAAGYTREALAESVGSLEGVGRVDMHLILRRTQSPTAYHTLVRLFFLGQMMPLAAVTAALGEGALEQLSSSGMIRCRGDEARAEAMLIPAEDFLIVHDFPAEVTGQPEASNHVLGVGRASITLANLTVRRQQERVLDLGTGSGIQGLLAARHATEVVATDVSSRALNFAGLNARLNGLSNITLRQGSLYEPVRDQQFDLIVANPPFVISPESRYLYRDSDLQGDAISEQVIRGAAAHLREGGYAVVLCNWHHPEEDWSERLRTWVTSNGCDAWLLCFKTDDPLTYAANWLRPTEGREPRRYGQILDAWLAYYAQMGIVHISYGAAILRRRSVSTNWLRTDMVPASQGVGSCSAQIQRIFAAQDLLADLQDEGALLEYPLTLAPDHQMEHLLKAVDGGWTVTEATLKLGEGLQFTGRVDRLISAILAGCDGRHALREMVQDIARGLGIDFEAVAPPCLEVMRRLMRMGFLVAARSSGSPHPGPLPEGEGG
jgi:methylase of polypeptide subunit release factors